MTVVGTNGIRTRRDRIPDEGVRLPVNAGDVGTEGPEGHEGQGVSAGTGHPAGARNGRWFWTAVEPYERPVLRVAVGVGGWYGGGFGVWHGDC